MIVLIKLRFDFFVSHGSLFQVSQKKSPQINCNLCLKLVNEVLNIGFNYLRISQQFFTKIHLQFSQSPDYVENILDISEKYFKKCFLYYVQIQICLKTFLINFTENYVIIYINKMFYAIFSFFLLSRLLSCLC